MIFAMIEKPDEVISVASKLTNFWIQFITIHGLPWVPYGISRMQQHYFFPIFMMLLYVSMMKKSWTALKDA